MVVTDGQDRLQDSFGRAVDYLRIAVTDRCNLQCIYCHPPYEIPYLRQSDLCSYEELLLVVKVASQLGVKKVRLTGGELFLRRDILKFIERLQRIEEIQEVGLTTNGTFLLPYLKRLKAIGLKRLNISLDTLCEESFFRITGSKGFKDVLKAIDRALEEGFQVKVNMVVLRGVNDQEILDFVSFFLKKSAEVRFIEFMPLCGWNWQWESFFSYAEILKTISRTFELIPLPSSGSAQEFKASNGQGLQGKVGIIAPLTRPFCANCSRIRLTANGDLRPCLFSEKKIPLLSYLRGDLSKKEKERGIREALRQAVAVKPPCLPEVKGQSEVAIRLIGG